MFRKMLVLRVPIQSQTNTSAGFHFSDMMFKCSFEPVPGKERGKKDLTVPAASAYSASSTAL